MPGIGERRKRTLLEHFGSVEAIKGATVEEIASKMTYFDLLTNAEYMDEFVKANFLPHTDLERFPSVSAGSPAG